MDLETTTVDDGDFSDQILPGQPEPLVQDGPKTIDDVIKEEEAQKAAPEAKNDQIEAGEVPMPAAYQPSFKYKFNGEEREIDEMFRPLIKDETTEKQIRELCEIREAFPKYKEAYSQYQEVVPHYQNLMGELEELGQLRRGNFNEFLKRMDLQPQQLLQALDPNVVKQYTAQLLQLEDLTPEQRHAYNEQQRVAREREQYQQQTEMYRQELLKERTERRVFELDQTLGTADVKDFQSKYDSIYGNGAFRQEVINTGRYAYQLQQRDLAPAEAVQQVMQKFGPLFNQNAPRAVETKTGEKVKVIPNVSARSSSPGKPKITSLAQIQKIAASYED
jgi:hypothetical protein